MVKKGLPVPDTLLNVASSLSGSTSAEGVGRNDVSDDYRQGCRFLGYGGSVDLLGERSGEAGYHSFIEHLVDWYRQRIKRYLDTPIVCSVQDEEVWIDNLDERCISEAWRGIEENSRYIDRFVTTSHFYKGILLRRLPGLRDIEVIYPGVDRDKYRSFDYPEDPVIGFFTG